jgi:hypothetical protein
VPEIHGPYDIKKESINMDLSNQELFKNTAPTILNPLETIVL